MSSVIDEKQVELLRWIENECLQIANELEGGSMSIPDAVRFLGCVRKKVALAIAETRSNEPKAEQQDKVVSSSHAPAKRSENTRQPITVDELDSIAGQYEDAANAIKKALECMEKAGKTELQVHHRDLFFKSLPMVNQSRIGATDAQLSLVFGRNLFREPSYPAWRMNWSA